MRFIVDECTGPRVAAWLRSESHEVFSIYEEARGASDGWILDKALRENWILITNDKDFGEMVYREQRRHRGVIFLRLHDERTEVKIQSLDQVLKDHADRLADCFVVVTESQIRFAKSSTD